MDMTDPGTCALLDFLARDRPAIAAEAIAYLRDNANEARYHDPSVGIESSPQDAEALDLAADALEGALSVYRR